jgi:hypothetical protein
VKMYRNVDGEHVAERGNGGHRTQLAPNRLARAETAPPGRLGPLRRVRVGIAWPKSTVTTLSGGDFTVSGSSQAARVPRPGARWGPQEQIVVQTLAPLVCNFDPLAARTRSS